MAQDIVQDLKPVWGASQPQTQAPEVTVLSFLPETASFLFVGLSSGHCFFLRVTTCEAENQMTVLYRLSAE